MIIYDMLHALSWFFFVEKSETQANRACDNFVYLHEIRVFLKNHVRDLYITRETHFHIHYTCENSHWKEYIIYERRLISMGWLCGVVL